MSAADNGGPAFPSHGSMGEVVHDGMSLRDHFAGEALKGLIGGRSWGTDDANVLVPMWAACSYFVADAMIAERAKPLTATPPNPTPSCG